MKLEAVEYNKCKRCAEHGYSIHYPNADAIRVKLTTGERVFEGNYKKHSRENCNPCGRDIKGKLTGHWKKW